MVRFLILITSISTIIVLITAEFIPKVLFRINPDFVLNLFIIPFHICYFLLWPIVTFILWISKSLIKLLTGEKYATVQPVFTKIDLDQFISQTGKFFAMALRFHPERLRQGMNVAHALGSLIGYRRRTEPALVSGKPER